MLDVENLPWGAGWQPGYHSVALAPDGRVLAWGNGRGDVVLWHRDRPSRARLNGRTGGVWSLTFSPDGRTLACGGLDGVITLWDVAGLRERAAFQEKGDLKWDVAFATNGTLLATGSRRGEVQLWDVGRGELRQTLSGAGAAVLGLAFSPGGEALAVSQAGGAVRLWDLAAGAAGRAFHLGPDAAPLLAFEPGGRLLAAAEGQRVLLWDRADEPIRLTAAIRAGAVEALAFPGDGLLLTLGEHGRTMRLWETATGKPVRPAPSRQRLAGFAALFPPGSPASPAGPSARAAAERMGNL